MRRSLFIVWVMILGIIIAACQGPPPTQIILVVTATPGAGPANDAQNDATAEALAATEEPSPAPTQTPKPTATTDAQPTPVVNQIQVAEQVFEGGRMFWLQPTGQIWVMTITREGGGEWKIYNDLFTEDDPDEDPQLIPPDGYEQPKRGFGKLWRENPEIRDALGWAITPEFGYVTRYEYHPSQAAGGPGFHLLTSLYEEVFRFNEADQTWQLN